MRSNGMRCERVERLLNMYIDKELPEKTQSIINGHLAGCDRCTHILNELNRLKELVGTTAPYPVNPFLWTRIAEGLKEEVPIPIGILVPKVLRVWVPIATILILLSGLMLYRTEKPVYKTKSLIQTAVLDIPVTPENMEKITLNLLIYTNGGIHYAKF